MAIEDARAEVAAEIDKLRKERDVARAWVCEVEDKAKKATKPRDDLKKAKQEVKRLTAIVEEPDEEERGGGRGGRGGGARTCSLARVGARARPAARRARPLPVRVARPPGGAVGSGGSRRGALDRLAQRERRAAAGGAGRGGGLTDTRSARAKKILPAGALLWAWDADPEFDEAEGEKWLVLLPARLGHTFPY